MTEGGNSSTDNEGGRSSSHPHRRDAVRKAAGCHDRPDEPREEFAERHGGPGDSLDREGGIDQRGPANTTGAGCDTVRWRSLRMTLLFDPSGAVIQHQ